MLLYVVIINVVNYIQNCLLMSIHLVWGQSHVFNGSWVFRGSTRKGQVVSRWVSGLRCRKDSIKQKGIRSIKICTLVCII